MDAKDSGDAVKVESSTAPDDGTPNVKPVVANDQKENGREIVKTNPRKGGKFGNRNENKNFGGGRRSFGGGPNEDGESASARGPRDHLAGREHGGPREFGGQRDYGGNRDHGGNRQDQGGWSSSEYFREKLYEISGPTLELPHLNMSEKKFNGRNRLYIGNIAADTTEEDIKKMFSTYGEISDVFLNRDKYFAFVVYDYHNNAERAKHELDGTTMNNDRQLRIRFSPRAATIRITNLPPTVTNELLFHGFSVFGEIEKAVVLIDERGRSTGVGEIDFARKKSASQAVKECTEGCFFLTNSLRPCIAEFYEPIQDTEGFGEKCIQWRNGEFMKDREVGPWLAKPNSFEFEFGTKWKQVRELYKQKEEALKKELIIEEDKMYAQMGFVKYEYETQMLKKQLEEREMYWEQQKLELEKKERMADELRLRNDEELRRREDQIKARLVRHEEELKIRQKETPYYPQQERRYDERSAEGWSDGHLRDRESHLREREAHPRDREGHPRDREGYWQRETAIVADDVISQGSRGRSSFLEEPGQVWKRLDEEAIGGDELFQRRPSQLPDEVPTDAEYAEAQAQWKRSWNDEYHYGKRGRF